MSVCETNIGNESTRSWSHSFCACDTDPEELDELSKVANVDVKGLHRSKNHMSLKEIEQDTLIACITQFAQVSIRALSFRGGVRPSLRIM